VLLRADAEARARLAQVRRGLGEVLERGAGGRLALEAEERVPRDERTDVVQHQPPDRRVGPGREQQADEPAHRGADPVELRAAAADPEEARRDRRGHARDQRRGVVEIGAEAVARFVLEPVAVAAADDVHGDDATLLLQRAGEIVEVARVARQAVHAQHDVAVVRIAPIAVGDAMEAVGPEAREALDAHR
jgi:hypothetical protein